VKQHQVIQRPEMLAASLDLGGAPLDLSDYATTGLMAVAVGPRGSGKSNAGLLIGEQLASQGWVSVLIDPEHELESMYGDAATDPQQLRELLASRERKIIVVSAADASEFIPYGEVILEAADDHRKPLYVFIDEGQLFSAPRKRSSSVGEASDIINDFVGRGRKRALDLCITALRYTGTLHRSIFSNKNLSLIGCQEDPTAWSALAPMFRASKIEFNDLNTLGPGEFFCFSRRGVEKIKMPMAGALRKVAPRAKAVKRALPANYRQWDRAVQEIPTMRLRALTDPVINLLGAVAGLSVQQMGTGSNALADELAARADA
jgi:hypothetical protein